MSLYNLWRRARNKPRFAIDIKYDSGTTYRELPWLWGVYDTHYGSSLIPVTHGRARTEQLARSGAEKDIEQYVADEDKAMAMAKSYTYYYDAGTGAL